MTRPLGWLTTLTAVALLSAACSGDDDGAEPTVTDPAAASSTTNIQASASSTTVTEPPAPSDVAPTYGVGLRRETFIDETRPTPPSGEQPGTATRVLESLVFYPAEGDPTAGAVEGAAADRTGGPYPLIVFSHGLGGTPEFSQTVLEAWASAGFVVVAPRFPLSRPDNPSGADAGDVQNQTGDVSFLIDTMTMSDDTDSFYADLVDPERIGASGHSNGAITTIGVTLHTCCNDDRIDVAVEYAGTASPYAGGEYDWSLAPPFLIVHGTDDELVAYANGVTLYNELTGPKGLFTMEGGHHSAMFLPDDPNYAEALAAATDFFRAHLLLDDAAALARLEASPDGDSGYPNLRFSPAGADPDVIPTTTVAGIDRQASVDATTDLADGQVVTVTWSGFTPDGVVNVVQCSAEGEGANFCDLSAARILIPNPTGSGSVDLEILVGAVGEGTCVSGFDGCVIAVNDSGLTEPEATIYIPLQFAG